MTKLSSQGENQRHLGKITAHFAMALTIHTDPN